MTTTRGDACRGAARREHARAAARDGAHPPLRGACAELYSATKIRGFLHLYIGEEAVAVGRASARSAADDAVVVDLPRARSRARPRRAGGRGDGRDVRQARPAAAAAAAARCTSSTPPRRFYGGNAIVAGGLPVAVGLALADQLRGRPARDRVLLRRRRGRRGRVPRVAQPGRAVAPAGALLLREQPLRDGHGAARSEPRDRPRAAARRLRHAGLGASTAWTSLAVRGRGPAGASTTCATAGGPCFLELRTYRFRAHSMYDPDRYRDKAEIERVEGARPDPGARGPARGDGSLTTPTSSGAGAREVATEIAAAVATAEAGRWSRSSRR